MSRSETVAWLADLQQRFGEMLRTPLDRQTGTLRAPLEQYGQALCQEVEASARLTAPERLAVYNQQYWFRLFTVLQREYKLTARLCGMWEFNDLAARYLLAHAPESHDLQRVADSMLPFLRRELAGQKLFAKVPCQALIEAASIDAAMARVFVAPAEAPLDPSALSAPNLAGTRLRQAESVAFVREAWPLLALRLKVNAEDDDGLSRLSLPARLPSPQHWLITRKNIGHAYAEIPAQAYRLYTLLAEHTVGEALAILEGECDAAQRTKLPAQVQEWLARGMRAGFWVGAT